MASLSYGVAAPVVESKPFQIATGSSAHVTKSFETKWP